VRSAKREATITKNRLQREERTEKEQKKREEKNGNAENESQPRVPLMMSVQGSEEAGHAGAGSNWQPTLATHGAGETTVHVSGICAVQSTGTGVEQVRATGSMQLDVTQPSFWHVHGSSVQLHWPVDAWQARVPGWQFPLGEHTLSMNEQVPSQ
jgi:hypothetical protein